MRWSLVACAASEFVVLALAAPDAAVTGIHCRQHVVRPLDLTPHPLAIPTFPNTRPGQDLAISSADVIMPFSACTAAPLRPYARVAPIRSTISVRGLMSG